MKVAFPQGLITEWYPRADYEVYQTTGNNGPPRRLQPNLNGIDLSLRSVTGAIEWNHVKVQPNTRPPAARERPEPLLRRARDGGGAALPSAISTRSFCSIAAWDVSRFRSPFGCRGRSDPRREPWHDAVPSVILFENRGGRIGYRKAGAIEEDAMTLDPPTLDGTLAQLRYDLENALVEQGLFLKEAQAMVETWRDSWFEEGARLIYIMPSRSIDAILPLRVEPIRPGRRESSSDGSSW